MKNILALFVFVALVGPAFGSPIGQWKSDHSATQMQFYVELKADKSLSMALRPAGGQTQWFKGTYTETNFTVRFPEKTASFPYEIHEDVLFLRFIANTPKRLLRVGRNYPEETIQTAQKLYDNNQPPTLEMVPIPVELSDQLPRLDTITRVELYQVNWEAGSPKKIGQRFVPKLIPKKVDLFSITNLTEISALYECLRSDLAIPCTLSPAGYASHQTWYSGTNVVLSTKLLNLYSSVVIMTKESPNAIFGESPTFAHKLFELHAKRLPGFAKRYAERFSSGESLSEDKHSFWKPTKKWKFQQSPAGDLPKAAPEE